MALSDELTWRGFINQTTYSDLTVLDREPTAFYFGVDPSARSMQVGNLAAAMMVRHFIAAGHRAYLLVGGATGMIGDPDGKADERNLKTLDEIAANKAGIATQYDTIFAGQPFEMVDNYDWFKTINYIDFLRNVGKHVPMSAMLGREFIKARLGEDGSGISYAEFSYSLIQGYDFLHLFREYGVRLQLCGADQWGNSVAGMDLIRRTEQAETHVLSMPLIINRATGKKFGKTEDGAVWLDPDLTSVYKFYQFWLNTDDAGVIDYMKIYTFLSKAEIEAVAENHLVNPGARLAQKTLAREVTTIVHGQDRREAVERVTSVLFGDLAFEELSAADMTILAAEIPTVSQGTTIVEALTSQGLAMSNGEARRLIEGGAIAVNGQKLTDDQRVDASALIKKGKNSFILVR